MPSYIGEFEILTIPAPFQPAHGASSAPLMFAQSICIMVDVDLAIEVINLCVYAN
jgi:hypothetical protein